MSRPVSRASTAKTWQQSAVETNYSPIKLVPNVRVHPSLVVTSSPESVPRYEPMKTSVSPTEFQTMTVHERLHACNRNSPSSLLDPVHNISPEFLNGSSRFEDHRKNLNTSPIKVRPSTALQPIVKENRFAKDPQLQCAHESMIVLAPNKSLVEAYRIGLQVHSPLKIVTHQKRGVKLPKLSPDKTANGVARNHHGGYYATMA